MLFSYSNANETKEVAMKIANKVILEMINFVFVNLIEKILQIIKFLLKNPEIKSSLTFLK